MATLYELLKLLSKLLIIRKREKNLPVRKGKQQHNGIETMYPRERRNQSMSIVYKRIDFTQALAGLIRYAYSIGYDIIIDWVLRNATAQKEMYDKGLSKCDGYNIKSRHQNGLAADLYIIEDGKISNDEEKYNKLHEYWEAVGGAPMVIFNDGRKDMGHFEWTY